jgi:hypothetical protein
MIYLLYHLYHSGLLDTAIFICAYVYAHSCSSLWNSHVRYVCDILDVLGNRKKHGVLIVRGGLHVGENGNNGDI